MYTISEIREVLNELEKQPADELEKQDLDFKEWNSRSMPDSIAL